MKYSLQEWEEKDSIFIMRIMFSGCKSVNAVKLFPTTLPHERADYVSREISLTE